MLYSDIKNKPQLIKKFYIPVLKAVTNKKDI